MSANAGQLLIMMNVLEYFSEEFLEINSGMFIYMVLTQNTTGRE